MKQAHEGRANPTYDERGNDKAARQEDAAVERRCAECVWRGPSTCPVWPRPPATACPEFRKDPAVGSASRRPKRAT